MKMKVSVHSVMSTGQGKSFTVCPQQNVWHCKRRDGRLHQYVNRGRSLEKWYMCNQLMSVPATAQIVTSGHRYINFRQTEEPRAFWNYRGEHDGFRTAGAKSVWAKWGRDSSSPSLSLPLRTQTHVNNSSLCHFVLSDEIKVNIDLDKIQLFFVCFLILHYQVKNQPHTSA